MPNPIDAGSDVYPPTPERETTPVSDDHQAAALTPEHQNRHTPDRERRDDSSLAKQPAGTENERGSDAAAPARAVHTLGIHAMGGAAAAEADAERGDTDEHPHRVQRVGTAALADAVHAAGDREDGREPATETTRVAGREDRGDEDDQVAAGDDHGGHDGPPSGSPDVAGHEDDDQSGDDDQKRKQESREPGTMSATELRTVLDKIATYGARETDEDTPPRVDLAALQQRLDAASAEGAETLRLDPAEVVELAHLEPQPSQLDKLAHFDDSETSRQPVADRILVERALSLMPVTRREVLVRSNPMGGSHDTATIAELMRKSEGAVQQHRWQGQQDFTRLADGLQRGDMDLKQYGIDHPKSRSPLTLLARLDEEIDPNARMDELRTAARNALRRTPLNDSQRNIMADLWGLNPGRRAVSTADVTAWTGYRGTSILNIERVMFGLQSANYHPERQARDER